MANGKNTTKGFNSQDFSIQKFNHEQFGEITGITDRNDGVWFVGNEVASKLQYARPKDAISSYCKGAVLYRLPTAGGIQNVKIIPEYDLYRLIMRSTMPKAEEFQDWVFEDVLPTIRKTGEYNVGTDNIERVSGHWKCFKSIAEDVGLTGNQLSLSVNRAVEKVDGVNCLELLGATALICEKQERHYTATALGKEFGLSGQKVNKAMQDAGIVESFRDSKDKLFWRSTEQGKSYTVLKDTNKKHGDGTPVQQLFYLESAKQFLR